MSYVPLPPCSQFIDCERLYTDDQMRAYGKACAAAEREECAKVADDLSFGPYELSGREIGNAIRARSDSTTEPPK